MKRHDVSAAPWWSPTRFSAASIRPAGGAGSRRGGGCCERVGIDDHFLDLGGHSLLATQIVSQVQSAFGVDVPLATLLDAPTVATMSVVVVERLAAEVDPTRLTHWLGRGGT